MLHTLNAAADSAAYRDCLRLLVQGDDLLLLGDAVYCALRGSPQLEALVASGARIHVMADDAAAAGVSDRLGEVPLVNIEQWLDLTERHRQQQAWY